MLLNFWRQFFKICFCGLPHEMVCCKTLTSSSCVFFICIFAIFFPLFIFIIIYFIVGRRCESYPTSKSSKYCLIICGDPRKKGVFQDVDVKIQVRSYLNFDVDVLKMPFSRGSSHSLCFILKSYYLKTLTS